MGTLDLRDKQVKDGSNVNIFIWILILMSVCIIKAKLKSPTSDFNQITWF